jgi:hypothetical protein
MTRKGLFHSLVLAGVLAAGFVVVWGVASLWAVPVVDSALGLEQERETLVFRADGTAVVASSRTRQSRDLEGRPVEGFEDGRGDWLAACKLPAAPRRPRGVVGWDRRIRSFSDGRKPAVYWYYVSDGRPDGTTHFVGYDSRTRRRVGYLGTAGFREEALPGRERIPFRAVLSTQREPAGHPDEWQGGQAPPGCVSPWNVYILAPGGKIYHADLHARTVRLIMDDPTLRSAALVAGPGDRPGGRYSRHLAYRLAARTDDAVLVLDVRGAVIKRYPIPGPLRAGDLRFAEATTGEAVMYWESPNSILVNHLEYLICWVSPDGRYREAETVLTCEAAFQPVALLGGLLPAPLALGGVVICACPPDLLEDGLAASYPEAVGLAVRKCWPALLTAQLVAAVFAALCYLRQRRYNASRAERVAWPLFVLALGLPGWLGYRFGRSWPALERCPGCGARAPQDREACGRCEAEFPRPALVGTEVFA